jgi:hypothetical protein
MELQQLVSALLTSLAVATTLAGLVVRGRTRQCWSFVAYLCALLAGESLSALNQARFYTPAFYMAKQAVYDILRTAVALEMAWQVVRAFPGALRTARWSALVLLAGSMAVLASGSPRAGYHHVLFSWQPRVVACTALLFTLTALLVAWYHLPMRRLHRAIMAGFAIYSAFFATILALLRRWGWEARPLTNALGALVLVSVICWWARAAWAREEEVMPRIEPLPVPEGPAEAQPSRNEAAA